MVHGQAESTGSNGYLITPLLRCGPIPVVDCWATAIEKETMGGPTRLPHLHLWGMESHSRAALAKVMQNMAFRVPHDRGAPGPPLKINPSTSSSGFPRSLFNHGGP